MKQIIGYMEYDYMNIKYGMLYMLAVFGIVSAFFSMQTGTGAVAYMMFCGLILAGTAFNTAMQSVSFSALAPGSIRQKVAGRYLGGTACIIVCAAIGLLSTGLVKLVSVSGAAEAFDDGMDLPFLVGLLGISLFFLAMQNVLLYLLTPILGIQFIGLVRMLPGFIMFFGVMSLADDENIDMISAMIREPWTAAGIILGIGILGMVVSAFCSCLILRNRDNV